MRTVILLAMGALLALTACAAAQDKSTAAQANALYRQGVLAMEQGETETARVCFEGVLNLQPSNPHARYQLRQLGLLGDRMAAKRRELKMKTVKLPKVEFEDLTLPEALDAINAVVERETEGKFTPNFVVEDPDNLLEARRFTLKLGQVPAAVALKYALDSANATARYDEHAIVIKPLGTRPEGKDKSGDPLDKPAPKSARDPFAR